eukprot:327683-Chlamydomonas_euryale.AAC.1
MPPEAAAAAVDCTSTAATAPPPPAAGDNAADPRHGAQPPRTRASSRTEQPGQQPARCHSRGGHPWRHAETARRAHPRNAHHQPARGAMQRGGGPRHAVAAVRGRRPWPRVVFGAGGDRRKQPWRDRHRGMERPDQHRALEDRSEDR